MINKLNILVYERLLKLLLLFVYTVWCCKICTTQRVFRKRTFWHYLLLFKRCLLLKINRCAKSTL